jgi:ATP-dependent Clp protease ATP-binding subunit ClpA
MFERFTEGARSVVARAQEEARSLRHGYIGTEHVVLGLPADTGLAARVLAELSFDQHEARSAVVEIVGRGPQGVSGSDAEVLRAIGIDLEEVRRRIEEVFGPGALDRTTEPGPPRRFRRRCEGAVVGHVPFTPRAKKALELSLREARHLGHDYIGTEHLLLGLLREGEGVDCTVLAAQGITYRRARAAIVDELRRGTGMTPPASGA